MVFSSVIFLFIFLPWTLIIHYLLDPRFRNTFLLIVSLIFYGWGEGYLTLLILGSIMVNYVGGILIGHFKNKSINKARFILGLFVFLNLFVLIYFKYFHFILENLNRIGLFQNAENPYVHLPIGISFYTFHIMSYLIDVYRRDAKPQKNPLDLGLYIFLFPQLVAGPIIRYKDISSKIANRFIIGEDFTAGAMRFIRGLAKKVIIANSVALIVDKVFAFQPSEIPTSLAWFAIICYTLQIYFDFSGYSDMAIGLGKMMGFNFPENFNYPYIAKSIQDFWQRWHISLSTWFRDYLYIPLGGNKKGNFATYRNLFIVFFVTGLWHGSSWNFIVWGLFHGTFLIIERIGFKAKLLKTPQFFQHFYTLFVVIIGWVFFRAPNFIYSLKYLKTMLGFNNATNFSAIDHVDWYNVVVFILALIFSTKIRISSVKFFNVRLVKNNSWLIQSGKILAYFSYVVIFIYCVSELARSSYNPFIYFRF